MILEAMKKNIFFETTHDETEYEEKKRDLKLLIRDRKNTVSVTEAKRTENLKKRYATKHRKRPKRVRTKKKESVEMFKSLSVSGENYLCKMLRMRAKLRGSWIRDYVIRRE